MTIDEREAGLPRPGTPAVGGTGPSDRPTRPPAADRARVWGPALVVGSYLVLAVIVYWQAWSSGVGSHLQLGGDQFANVWYLRWTPFALLHGHDPLFTDYANYPFGVNLVTNTSAPLLGLLGMPVTLVAGSIATFNVLSTAALAGSATAGYAFARRFTDWRPAAWVGGLLYGFSPYQIGQASGHLNLTFVVLPPLILLVLHEVVVRQAWSPRRAGVTLGLLVTAQFFVSSEILASTIVIGTVCLVTVVIIGRHSVADRIGAPSSARPGRRCVAAVLLAYPVWFALRGPGSISGPIQLVPEAYRADLFGLVYPGAFMWIAPCEPHPYLRRVRQQHRGERLLPRDHPRPHRGGLGGGAVDAVDHRPGRRRRRGHGLGAVARAGRWWCARHPERRSPGSRSPSDSSPTCRSSSNTIPVRYSLYVALFARARSWPSPWTGCTPTSRPGPAGSVRPSC